MNAHETNDAVRRFLDGELSEEERSAFEAELTGDPARRLDVARMGELEGLLSELSDGAPEPPRDLVHGTMRRVSVRPAPRLSWWRRFTQSIAASPPRLALAGATLSLLGLFVGLGIGVLQSRSADPVETKVTAAGEQGTADAALEDGRVVVHFVLHAPEAGRVSVVGDFNGWDPEANLLRRSGDVWRGMIALPRGRYEYQFVVDGDVWLVDPAAPGTVDDGFGGRNGVLEV